MSICYKILNAPQTTKNDFNTYSLKYESVVNLKKRFKIIKIHGRS